MLIDTNDLDVKGEKGSKLYEVIFYDLVGQKKFFSQFWLADNEDDMHSKISNDEHLSLKLKSTVVGTVHITIEHDTQNLGCP